MVVHLTTTQRSGDPFRWEVEVPRGVAGLQATSTIKCNEVYTLLKTHLDAVVGTLPRSYLERVDRALAVSLGLGPHRLR
jgi:mRNA-degrading endonuclease toxin of MazEF toxin-antitoxin module